jgi:hypothetical protein
MVVAVGLGRSCCHNSDHSFPFLDPVLHETWHIAKVAFESEAQSTGSPTASLVIMSVMTALSIRSLKYHHRFLLQL